MSTLAELMPSMLDRIRHDLVGLKMPRALEALDGIVRRLEQGEVGALQRRLACLKPATNRLALGPDRGSDA